MRRAAVVGVVLSACSFEHGALSPDSTVPADMAQPDVQLGPWGAPVELSLSSGLGDDDPSLTDDMLEIYWGSRRDPNNPGQRKDEDIYTATRSSVTAPWGPATPVAALNSSNTETTMKVTGSGLALFFTSDRGGNADIYLATRSTRTSPWNSPVKVNELSSGGGDYGAFAQSTMKHLVMCSGVDVTTEALYHSERPTSLEPWGTPIRISELDDTGISECDPMEPSPPASGVMYYSSQRGNADFTYDIYRAQRATATDPWASRTKLDVGTINVDGADDRDPWVSGDERTMFFSSQRGGTFDKLYVSTR